MSEVLLVKLLDTRFIFEGGYIEKKNQQIDEESNEKNPNERLQKPSLMKHHHSAGVNVMLRPRANEPYATRKHPFSFL